MRIVFMGSPELAVRSLEALHASQHSIVLVVTQPGRPQGRGRRVLASPVRLRAEELGLQVVEPIRLDRAFRLLVRSLSPSVLVVVAYGKLLRPVLLRAAPLGAINLHPSLLPRHRGAGPIQHAVLCGDRVTGVSIMQLEEGLDTGPLLAQTTTPIGDQEDAEELSDRLGRIGADLLVRTLDDLERGAISAVPQAAEGITYAGKLGPTDAWLDWSKSAAELAARVRGLRPWPIAQTTTADGHRLKILRARVGDGQDPAPAIVVSASSGGIEVSCGSGRLIVLEAQPEGARAMTAQDLINGRRIKTGEKLGG